MAWSGVEWSAEDDHSSSKWLRPVLQSSIFGRCKVHKSECNMFYLDCIDGPLCSHCLDFHKDHRHIQIRRASYYEVIRVEQIERYFDITGIQTYTINKAKIVYLNQRPHRRGKRAATNTCCIFDRSLLASSTFCSIGCKEKMRMDHGGASDSMNAASILNQVVRSKVQGFTPSAPP